MHKSIEKTFGAETWAILPSALDSIARLITNPKGDVNPHSLVPDNRAEWRSYKQVIGSTAIIHINGPIFYNILYFGTNLQIATRDFLEALADKSIKQIILHINSPGGILAGVREFAQMVFASRGKKKIIGYAQGMCASAACWIFSACGFCIADPTALLGSIGVMFQFEDDSEYYENMGVKTYTVISDQSPKKNISPADPEGKKEYQALANSLAAEFISDVAMFRNVSTQVVESDFGQGFVMPGDKAVKAGMADEVGTIQDLLEGRILLTQPKGEGMGKENKTEATAEIENTEGSAASENTDTEKPKGGKENTETPSADADIGKKVDQLITQNAKMLSAVEKLTAENKDLKAKNEELQSENADLKAENEELAEQPDEGETPRANGMSDSVDRGW